MSDHRLYVGTNGRTEYLARLYDDGTLEIADRPDENRHHTWGPPVTMTELAAEVTS